MTGIRADYKVLIDLDQDGYFNQNVLPTDNLNLIRGARHNGIRWNFLWSYEAFDIRREYFYHTAGVWIYIANQTAGLFGAGTAPNAINFGGGRADSPPPQPPDCIPVLPNTQYTMRILCQVVTGNTSVTLTAYDQSFTGIATDTQTQVTLDWVVRTLTFTTLPTSLFISVSAGQDAQAGDQEFRARGFFLVQGDASALPAAYNAGDPTNPYDNISSYVETLSWNYGIPQYSDAISQASRLAIGLNNRSGDWTPENTGSLYATQNKGRLIRVSATFNAVERILWQGVSTNIQVDVGAHSPRRAILIAGDPLAIADESEYYAALQLNVRTDQVLSQVFDSGAVLYPYAGHNWLMGVPGASELGSTSTVFLNLITDFEQGDSTFTFAGDITGADQPITAGKTIREYAYAELGGRLWWHAPALKFKFTRRSHDARTTPTLVVIDHMELDNPPRYVWGDDVLNDFTLNFYPRTIGAVGSILYALGNLPYKMSPGATRTFNVRFSSPTARDSVVAALTTITPVAGTDYVANAAADGSGASKTASVAIEVRFSATGAEILLANNDAADIYITTLQLRGTPLTALSRDSVRAADGVSIVRNGSFKRTLDLQALDDPETATSYVNYLVQRYKEPLGRIESFSIWANRSADTMTKALDLEVGDAVQVYDPVLMNQITDYTVTALAHEIKDRGTHDVRVTVEPLNRAAYWLLEDGVLGLLEQTTRLGF